MKSHSQINNFDFIRLFLALSVFLFHISELTKLRDFQFLGEIASASIAVHSFFIVSGFLIFMSYERSKSIKRYFVKRLRRIAPGYIAVIILSFIFLSTLTALSPGDYFSSPESIKFLLANLSTLNFLHPTLPGVFTDHYYKAVNGALWTIKVEVLFYLSVPLIAYFYRWVKPDRLLVLIFLMSAIYYFATGYIYEQSQNPIYLVLQRQLPAQMMFFSGGALLYYRLKFFKHHSHFLFFIAVSIYILYSLASTQYLYPLYALSLSVMIIYVALIFPYLGHIAKYGDLSYGIYIWHFPVVQTFISLHLFDSHPIVALCLLILTVLLLALLSWHLIEKPFLGNKSHYMEEDKSKLHFP